MSLRASSFTAQEFYDIVVLKKTSICPLNQHHKQDSFKSRQLNYNLRLYGEVRKEKGMRMDTNIVQRELYKNGFQHV